MKIAIVHLITGLIPLSNYPLIISDSEQKNEYSLFERWPPYCLAVVTLFNGDTIKIAHLFFKEILDSFCFS